MASLLLISSGPSNPWITAQLVASMTLLLCAIGIIAFEVFKMKLVFGFANKPIQHEGHTHENSNNLASFGGGSVLVYAAISGLLAVKKSATKWFIAALLGGIAALIAAMTGSFYAMANVRQIGYEWNACTAHETQPFQPQPGPSMDYYTDWDEPSEGRWMEEPYQKNCDMKQLFDWHLFEVLLSIGNIVASLASLACVLIASCRLAGYGPVGSSHEEAQKEGQQPPDEPEEEEGVEEVKI